MVQHSSDQQYASNKIGRERGKGRAEGKVLEEKGNGIDEGAYGSCLQYQLINFNGGPGWVKMQKEEKGRIQ